MTDGAPTRVVVEVDQVVLHGRDVSHHDVVRFRAALATELGRLFGGTTLLAGWREPGRIHAWDQLALSLPTLPADGDGLGRTTARASARGGP